MHQLDEVVKNLRQAFDFYVENEDISNVIAVATTHVGAHAGLASESIIDMLQVALDLVPKDSHNAGRLFAILGYHAGQRGELELATEAFNNAVTIAQREEDKFLEMCALVDAANTYGNNYRYKAALDAAIPAIELARKLNKPERVAMAQAHAAGAQIADGSPLEAEKNLLASLEAAEKSRQFGNIASILFGITMFYTSQGNWDTAKKFGDRGLDMVPDDGRTLGILTYLVQVLM